LEVLTLNIRRKAFSIGASAALLASVFASAGAPSVLATSAATNVGTILRGGAASTATTTITVNEDTVNQWADGSVTLTLTDSAAGSTISFSGTPVCTATGTPGITCAAAVLSGAGTNDVLKVTVTGTSTTRTDGLTVTGLKIKAMLAAPTGAVSLTSSADGIGLSNVSATASGILNAAVIATATSLPYILNAGSPAFQVSATNKVAIGAPNAESVAVTVVGGAALTTAATASPHAPGVTLTQTVSIPFSVTVATVSDTTTLSSAGTAVFVSNTANQCGSLLTLALGYAGYVAKGTVVTFHIVTAGVQFSGLSGLGSWEGVANGTSVLSLDRQTITYTTGSTTVVDGSVVTYGGCGYDVAAGVPNGTAVEVSATVGALNVSGSPATVGTVGTTLVGFSASQPPASILTGTNDQTTSLLTLRELAAGTIQDELSATYNGFEVCLETSGVTFSRAPWAVVTVGDLWLNNAGVKAKQVAMTMIDSTCYGFRVFQQSTVASTIEIRGGADAANTAPLASGPTNGPRVNVDYNEQPQQVYVNGWLVNTGNLPAPNWSGASLAVGTNIVVAYIGYGSTISVKALSAPYVQKGVSGQLAGSIQISESRPGQLGYFYVCLPQSSLALASPNVTFSSFGEYNAGFYTADMPRIDTNNAQSGMTATFDGWFTRNAGYDYYRSPLMACFDVDVSASLTGPGVVTISNILYDVKSDAPNGGVQVEIFNASLFDKPLASAGPFFYGDGFDKTIINANIGVQPMATFAAGTTLGATKNAAFTTATKVAKLNGYVTWRFRGPAALAGKTVGIMVSTKQADGTWGAFTRLTGRVVDLNGDAYFWWKFSKPTWIAVKAFYPGDGTYAPSTSASPQARWK
jgi:hypothetical protein